MRKILIYNDDSNSKLCIYFSFPILQYVFIWRQGGLGKTVRQNVTALIKTPDCALSDREMYIHDVGSSVISGHNGKRNTRKKYFSVNECVLGVRYKISQAYR